jgi:hypothetical protein
MKMDRITLTRAEAVALLLLTGPGGADLTRKNKAPALKMFPELARVLNETTQKEVDDACYNFVEKVRTQLVQFNEGIINRERTERERQERAKQNDLFYKNVTGLLKKVNDTVWLTGKEGLDLALARYPEADIRENRLGKLEYFGRKSMSTPPVPRGPVSDNSLSELLKTKLPYPPLVF